MKKGQTLEQPRAGSLESMVRELYTNEPQTQITNIAVARKFGFSRRTAECVMTALVSCGFLHKTCCARGSQAAYHLPGIEVVKRKTSPRTGCGMIVWNLDVVRDRCAEVGECWIWNRGVNAQGYPSTTIGGKPGTSVKRFVVQELMGKTIQTGKFVSSACGQILCVSPHCLRIRSRSEANKAAYERLKKHPGAVAMLQQRGRRKLDYQTAQEIREQTGSNAELAERYGVRKETIQRIRTGRTWARPYAVNSVWGLAA